MAQRAAINSWGVGTNVDFPFAFVSDTQELTLFLAAKKDGKTVIETI